MEKNGKEWKRGVYFIFFTLLFYNSLKAQELSLRKFLGNFNIQNHLHGEYRIGYLNGFLGVGGHWHIKPLRIKDRVKLNSSFYASWNNEEEKVLFLAEANLEYFLPKLKFKVGRFTLDTPYANSDDIRIVPNYFQGVEIKGEKFEFFYLSKMAGWGSGEKIGEFKSLGKVLGAEVGGLYGGGINLDFSSIWLYHLVDGGSLAYLEKTYQKRGFTIAFELIYNLSQNKDLFSTGLAIGGSISKKKEATNYFLGYNKILYGEVIPAFGSPPYFTSLEVLTLDMAKKKAQSWVIGVEEEIEGVVIGSRGGEFKSPTFLKQEIDFYLFGKLTKHLSLELVASRVENSNLLRGVAKFGF
ncbi:MAG: hypothetical protein GXO61_05680 [Epsilonproteobacteria bacterium]|nr:hypothetical protein [Campylobacterota bacterium]